MGPLLAIIPKIERLWQVRGPAPGMTAALGYLGVESAHRVVRRLVTEPDWVQEPWEVVQRALEPSDPLGEELRASLPKSVGLTWRGLADEERTALKILSAMDVSRDQIVDLMGGRSTWEVTAEELVENPYFAATCTYRSRNPISLVTVDQACFPAPHVEWVNLVESLIGLDDPGDARRLEALMVEVLERLAEEGDTVAGEAQILTAASQIPLTRVCPISRALLTAHKLDAPHLADYEHWTPLVEAHLDDGLPAYKLRHLYDAGFQISEHMKERRAARRFALAFNPRTCIDESFGLADPSDEEEELARREKAAGLAELFASRLTVLTGPAGTGKTSLLKTLVAIPEIAKEGVLLLAPTGKARVQMKSKVEHPAQTLASFLLKKDGYEPDTGRYLNVDRMKRVRVGLVVIDEASMLTEEMLAATLSAVEGMKRLVLVGDHRQLPPIGSGRPFVDIVEWLKPDTFDGDVRVAPGYVELTVFRRQRGEDGTRDDLALARWFGGEDLPASGDEIWHRLRLGAESDTLAYRQWGNGDDAHVTLPRPAR